MPECQVGVLGATSMVGQCLLHLLNQDHYLVTAYSRHAAMPERDGVQWRRLPSLNLEGELPLWICLAPIWVLPEYFSMLESHGAKKLVLLSSTSVFSKNDSSDPHEQALARRLMDAEMCVQAWAENRGVEWVILRPTLIYGLGLDKNVTEIAHFIKRFGFFPLFGKACGLRQPVHAQDLALACISALQRPETGNRAYNLSGGETLEYHEMIGRIFNALGRRPRLLTMPLWMFTLGVTVLRCLPRYRQWSSAMAERMECDLVFDHAEARRDLDFKPRSFVFAASDMAT